MICLIIMVHVFYLQILMMNNSPSTNNNILVIKKLLSLDFNHNHSAFSRESQPLCTESQTPCASMSPVTVYPDFCCLYIYICQ